MERAVPPDPEPSPETGASYQPAVRAREKQAAREADARALASGEKSPEELRRERGAFAFPHVRIDLDGVIAFE
jgi:hypothetical protein